MVALFATVCITASAQQQRNGDPAAMMQRMKERMKPGLIEKTKISDEQADKVIEINFNYQRKKRDIRMDQNLSDDEKKQKAAAIDEAETKELKAIPLTDDQLSVVSQYFEDMRKAQMERRRNGGGN